jgi:rubrerythrin
MTMLATKTARRRAPAFLTHDDILDLLNKDFVQECRSIFGYAVYAERIKAAGDEKLAAMIEQRGREEVVHSLTLCQLIYDFGGSVTSVVDEMNAVLNADRVADPAWTREAIRRLRDRSRQLRAVGEPGLAKRLARVVSQKRALPDLAELLG